MSCCGRGFPRHVSYFFASPESPAPGGLSVLDFGDGNGGGGGGDGLLVEFSERTGGLFVPVLETRGLLGGALVDDGVVSSFFSAIRSLRSFKSGSMVHLEP